MAKVYFMKKILVAFALCIVIGQDIFAKKVETISNNLRISGVVVNDRVHSALNNNNKSVRFQEIGISVSNTVSQSAQGVVRVKVETLDGSVYLAETVHQTGEINPGGEITFYQPINVVNYSDTIRVVTWFDGQQETTSHLYANSKIDLRRQSLFWNDFNERVDNYGWSTTGGGFEIYSGSLARDTTPCLRHASSGTETGSLTSNSFKVTNNQRFEVNFWVKYPSSDSGLTIDFGPVGGTKTTLYNGSADSLSGGNRHAVVNSSGNGWNKLTLYPDDPVRGDYDFTLSFQGEVLMDDFSFGYVNGTHGMGDIAEFSWSYNRQGNPQGITTQTDVELINRIKPSFVDLLDHTWDIYPNTYTWINGNRESKGPKIRFTQPGWYKIRLGTGLMNLDIHRTYRTKYIHVAAAPAITPSTRHRRSVGSAVSFYPNPISSDGKLFIRTEGFSEQEAKLSVPTDLNYIPISFVADDTDHEVDLSALSLGQHILLLEIGGEKFFENIVKP